MRAARYLPLLLASATLHITACAPPLNWREVKTDGGALSLLLPCKPERRTRQVVLAEAAASMEVLACDADGTTWGLTSADLGSVATVGAALAALRAARPKNLDGRETAAHEVRIGGLSRAAQPLRLRVEGRKPNGEPVVEHSMLFARGSRIFHAVALGGAPSPDALETFFGSLRLAS